MDTKTRQLERAFREHRTEATLREYVLALQRAGQSELAERLTLEFNLENLRKQFQAHGVQDWDELESYNEMFKALGHRQCYCENSLCGPHHVTAPGEEKPNPGLCLNDAPPGITYIDYMGDAMCNMCAQHMPDEYHLDSCNCTKCEAKSENVPQQVASMLDDDGDFREPDPTEEGWHEDWESEEFDDDDDEWSWGPKGDV
jgi:hypothetical protein